MCGRGWYGWRLKTVGQYLVTMLVVVASAQIPLLKEPRMMTEMDITEQLRRVLVDGEDRFLWLTEEAKRELSSDDGSTARQKINMLHDFDAPPMVDVQLVAHYIVVQSIDSICHTKPSSHSYVIEQFTASVSSAIVDVPQNDGEDDDTETRNCSVGIRIT